MKSVTLHTRYGEETHFVHELDKVILCKTEGGIIAVGFMDTVSGVLSEEDWEMIQATTKDIVEEISSSGSF
ncbi:MAG TPA: hypothetical protein VMS31_08165 [Pyrinomonadaceae bacterium]|nr:hypothetical protein [Pyrinomonadaceae bacterium]